MPQRATKEIECNPVAMAALNEIVEALLDAAGNKAARKFLQAVASRAAMPEENVERMREPGGALHTACARGWLQTRLPGWLSKYG